MEGINPAIRILVSCNLNFNSTDRNPQKQLQNFRIWINALFTLIPAVDTRKGTAKLNHGDIEEEGRGEEMKMQKLFLLIISGFFVCLLSCSPIQKAAETSPSQSGIERAIEVQCPDTKLEAAIRQSIDKPEGQITETDLQSVTLLTAENKGISDITGIEKCVNLEILNLPGNEIGDISSLNTLTKLKLLTISDNKITDISPLSRLTNVEILILAINRIVDIQPLSNLTNLETLWLMDNQITDIGALSHLTKLRKVGLDCNKIVDVKPLSNLPYLTVLGLQSNQVSDISPLASNLGIGKWDKVRLGRNPLNDEAYDTHIPALQGRGVKVSFDPRD